MPIGSDRDRRGVAEGGEEKLGWKMLIREGKIRIWKRYRWIRIGSRGVRRGCCGGRKRGGGVRKVKGKLQVPFWGRGGGSGKSGKVPGFGVPGSGKGLGGFCRGAGAAGGGGRGLEAASGSHITWKAGRKTGSASKLELNFQYRLSEGSEEAREGKMANPAVSSLRR